MILHTFRYPREARNTSPITRIVFLHGMGGTGSLWRPIAAHLEERYDLLCPDQRGHGESRVAGPTTPSDFTPLCYGQDLVDTLRSLHFSPTWLVGHSMGVRTACGYAKLWPESLLGMVLIDLGFSGVAGGGIGEALATFLGDLPSTFPTRSEARIYLQNHCPDPSIAQYLIAVAKTDPKTGVLHFPFDQNSLLQTIEASRESQTGPWMREFAEKTGRPVYVLRGAESSVYSRSDFERDRRAYADLKNVFWVEVEGAGHGLPFEKRAEFLQLLESWIKHSL